MTDRGNVVAIQPHVNLAQLAKEARQVHVQIQDGERIITATGEKVEQRRLQLGKLLVEARKAFPSSGPKAAGWGRWIADIGLSQQTAYNYMRLAGHVEEVSQSVCETPPGSSSFVPAPFAGPVPTYAEAGIVKRPPARDLEPEKNPAEQGERELVVARGEKEILQAAEQIKAKQREERREERVERIRQASAGNAELALGRRFPVILADNPWQYDDSSSRGAAEDHYPTMPLDDLCALPVGKHATDDAVLFMWAVSPLLPDAFAVMAAWGFDYRASAVWPKARMGLGHWFRIRHEFLLVGVRGDMPPPPPSARPDSILKGEMGEHSRKPETVYELIERMWPDLPRLEMFARRPRDGWTVWGNESGGAQ